METVFAALYVNNSLFHYLQEFKYDCSIEMPSSELSRKIKNFKKFGITVTIKGKPKGFSFSIKGIEGGASFNVLKTEPDVKIKADDIVELAFDVK